MQDDFWPTNEEIEEMWFDDTIVEAEVVDGHVTFKGEKFPIRNELEN